MAVSRFFGLPGCGKTTTLAMLAYKALMSGKYDHVYCNVHMNMPGVVYVPFDVLGNYQLENCLVLIDEAMVECGDRDYKGFGKEKIELFVMHRHYKMDIVLFSQEADGVDKKIRSISCNMYYVKKGLLTGPWITSIYKIPYGIVWPSQNDNGENLGKIVMGYTKPSLFSRLFARRIWRPKYYKYFDSWDARELPALPRCYEPVPGNLRDHLWLWDWFRLGRSLAKWAKKYRKLRESQLRQTQEDAALEYYRSRSDRQIAQSVS